jgi:acetoacetyl-CoA synthetase
MTLNEGDLLWTPGAALVEQSNVTRFIRWLARHQDVELADYPALWQWSVDHLDDFWQALWDYFAVHSPTPHTAVLGRREMPGAEWFPGARINYAEHMLRNAQPGTTAIYHLTENTPLQELSWDELGEQVRTLATALREMGVCPGDRVVAYLPNIPETVVALLATTAIGAIWSCCSPDFGMRSVVDRFSQIEPKVLIACDGYRFAGKEFDRRDEVRQIVAELPSLQQVIYLPWLSKDEGKPPTPDTQLWREIMSSRRPTATDFSFEPVAFEHPLWILYSSGTTGLPKPIVHSHGGTTLEHLKVQHFHLNAKPGTRVFFYTTSGWMMWNAIVSTLIVGGSPILYEGNPAFPEPDQLWKLAAETRANVFGASPTFVGMMVKAGIVPKERFDLSALDCILLGGSPATPESMQWCYEAVKQDLWVTSQSGGTDICSGFVGASPTLPVYAGEIQTRMLGVDVQAWDDNGQPLIDEVGELVVCQPMPSMPIGFWNDADNARYLESYFEMFPGKWRHGDFLKINARGGCFIYGRSDSTLNRYGVRIGTAEIYRALEQLPEVLDSLIVNLDLPHGRFFMPLFVRLKPGQVLDDAMIQKINAKLKTDCSPRHVPDKVLAVEAIPYTLTAKKMEVPVRKILAGADPAKAANRDAMANPAAIDWFVRYAAEQKDYSTKG